MEWIKTDFDAFCQRIKTYQENISNPDRRKDNCEAAYEGLYKLIQRIKKELNSGTLNKQESGICCEIRDDRYLKGLLKLRTVATHIQSDTAKKNGSIRMYVPEGSPVEISCEVSAGSMFSINTVIFPKSPSTSGGKIDHLHNLNTAKERIEKKLKTLTS